MSRVVVLAGSSRKGGNTDLLVRSFVEGAEAHNEVTVLSVAGHRILPCIGCNSCFKSKDNACFQRDDMGLVYDALKQADLLVIASPVYFYGLSAQLKAVIDRLHNPIRNTFPIKRLGLILVGADTLPELFDAIITQYELTMKFFHLGDAGRVLVRGAEGKGDVNQTDGLRAAHEFGKSLR